MAGVVRNWKQIVKEMDGAWKNAESAGYASAVEDGIYEAVLVSATAGISQAGRAQIAWVFVVSEGEEKGSQIRDWDGIPDDPEKAEERFGFIKMKLAQLGCEVPDSLSELEATLEEVSARAPRVLVQVKTKVTDTGSFTHASVNKLLEEQTSTEAARPTPKRAKDVEPEAEEETETEPAEEDSNPTPDGDDVELKIGTMVQFPSPKTGNPLLGEVIEIDEEEETLKVKTKKGNEYEVSLADIALVEPEDDEE